MGKGQTFWERHREGLGRADLAQNPRYATPAQFCTICSPTVMSGLRSSRKAAHSEKSLPTFEITPVHVGSRQGTSLLFCYLAEPQPLTVHYRLWVLRNGSQTIVVDSGLPAEEAFRRGIVDARDVATALAQVSVDAASVSTVVLTHLHWDHASNAGVFPRATFVAQRSELEWLTNPLIAEPTIGRFYSDLDQFARWADDGRFRLLDGDQQIIDGVAALHVGGHTPGHQLIAVDVTDGVAVIAGDAIPLNRNYIERIPTAIHIDLLQAMASLDRVRAMAPVALYTGHDPEPVLDLSEKQAKARH